MCSDGTMVALRMLRHAGQERPGMRLLDVAYGPQSRELRAKCAANVLNAYVPNSSKHVQWGNWRRMMLDAVGVTGACIAEADKAFERKVAEFLGLVTHEQVRANLGIPQGWASV